MLTVFDGNETVGSMSRRRLLEIGGLGLGGLSLYQLLSTKALASDQPNPLTGKSVIFLFQQGGPSQFETFDPKPYAPSGIRTVGDVVSTSIPGVQFGASMSQLAKLAHKFNVVRSFATRNAGHNIQPIVSSFSKEAAISTHFARIAGPPVWTVACRRRPCSSPLQSTKMSRDLLPEGICLKPATTVRALRHSCPARAASCRRT